MLQMANLISFIFVGRIVLGILKFMLLFLCKDCKYKTEFAISLKSVLGHRHKKLPFQATVPMLVEMVQMVYIPIKGQPPPKHCLLQCDEGHCS